MVRYRAQQFSTFFPVYFSEAASLSFVFADLWFPRSIIADRYYLLVTSYIGDWWYWEPF